MMKKEDDKMMFAEPFNCMKGAAMFIKTNNIRKKDIAAIVVLWWE